jgi:hypothetical protein
MSTTFIKVKFEENRSSFFLKFNKLDLRNNEINQLSRYEMLENVFLIDIWHENLL